MVFEARPHSRLSAQPVVPGAQTWPRGSPLAVLPETSGAHRPVVEIKEQEAQTEGLDLWISVQRGDDWAPYIIRMKWAVAVSEAQLETAIGVSITFPGQRGRKSNLGFG